MKHASHNWSTIVDSTICVDIFVFENWTKESKIICISGTEIHTASPPPMDAVWISVPEIQIILDSLVQFLGCKTCMQ